MTTSRKKKKLRRILDSLEKAKLSNNKGKFISAPFKLTKKQKRHSGRRYPKIFGSQRILDEEGISVEEYWDDWVDHRDSWRIGSDEKHFFKKWRACCFNEEEVFQINKRIKKLRERRKANKN